jgi:hypothetical protein
LPLGVILGIAVFGLVGTLLVISINVTSTQFKTESFVLQNVSGNDTTILASPAYAWILHYVFHKENVPNDYSFILYNPIHTGKILLVADPHFLIDLNRGKKLQELYNDSKTITAFDEDLSKYDISSYPYSNIKMNLDGTHVEVKIK